MSKKEKKSEISQLRSIDWFLQCYFNHWAIQNLLVKRILSHFNFDKIKNKNFALNNTVLNKLKNNKVKLKMLCTLYKSKTTNIDHGNHTVSSIGF